MENDSDSDCAQADAVKNFQSELSLKSKIIYEAAYNGFIEWREKNKLTSVSEDVLMTYFEEIKSKFKPTTLYALYSKLKTTLSIKDNVDLDTYTKLKDFLKVQSKGYRPKKSKSLTTSQIDKFIKEAPDSEYLLVKVALIMGVAGACRKHELYQMKASNVEDLGTAVLITIPHSETKEPRRFVLTGNFYTIFKKYADLRPPNTKDPHFFLSYLKGKCAKFRTGKNKFGRMGKQIAKYLKLPNAEAYTGHCFRRSSASSVKVHAGWKLGNIPDEYMKGQFGITNRVLSAIDNKAATSTAIMGDREESNLYTEIESDTLKEEKCAHSTTSLHSSSENETNDRPYSVGEDPLADEMYQDDDEDFDSEIEDKNVDMCDVSETQILQDQVAPLTVNVNSEGVSSKECDLFGEYIAKHLQRLPVEMALKLQSGIQALVLQTRLEYIREHPNEAPVMVKEEPPQSDATPPREEPTDTNNDKQAQTNKEKRPQKADQQQQPTAKRFKPNNSGSEMNKSNSTEKNQSQNKRTEFIVFAEHIALQLEQLPEDVSIQLQTEIYDLITQTYSKHTDENIPNRAKIKDEVIDVDDLLE